ncbi:MAG: hypothetical protein IKH67_03895 [Lachnospiraceae bacterium]|nr:hypothetical protein [Lachnospiraceae bacterium]
MKTKKTTYYLIRDRLVGKREKGSDYLFRDGEWVPDERGVIMKRLIGFDPWEPEDSPYRFGSLSIMDDIEEISFEEAMKIIGG